MPSPSNSRAKGRLGLLARALAHSLGPRRAPGAPATILVAHRLLLGDTLMLAPLFAALRRQHPAADIVTTCAPALVPLFAGRPYGVRALAFDPRQPETLAALYAEARRLGGFDLALVPGDNRHALLARALGSRWIAALAADRPAWKNALCDELRPWPAVPTALADIFASLAAPAAPGRYAPADWPAPPAAPFQRPAGPYAVLHVGAGSPLRHWAPAHWQALAEHLEACGLQPVWSCGPGETAALAGIDAVGRYPAFPGTLDLAQLWQLLAGARLLVCPDTGVAHLGKVVGVPTVCLFGPGSPALFGAGSFWSEAPFAAVGEARFPCRDQHTLFKRVLPWVERCQRSPRECQRARCMEAVGLPAVQAAIATLLPELAGDRLSPDPDAASAVHVPS